MLTFFGDKVAISKLGSLVGVDSLRAEVILAKIKNRIKRVFNVAVASSS